MSSRATTSFVTFDYPFVLGGYTDNVSTGMPDPTAEISLTEVFADTKVIGVTIIHEGMTDAEIETAIADHAQDLKLPVTDSLTRPGACLANLVISAYRELQQKPVVAAE